MDNDDIYCFECPACNAALELNTDGEVSVYAEPELKSNQRRGIGGLVTETNVADRFYQDDYLRNQNPKPTMQPLSPLGGSLGSRPVPTPEPITLDPSLMEANKNDLKKRNLK